jgi:fido (protein-threonine AMPylation protein)
VFRRRRLKKAHAKFLESCRNLKEGRAYWDQAKGLRRWILELVVPVPLLGLHEEGQRLLSALQWLEANGRDKPLSEEVIVRYHRVLYPDGAPGAGEYRKGRATVAGSAVPRAEAPRIAALMKQLDLKLADAQKRLDGTKPVDDEAVLALAVDAYQRLGLIHPFADGNGRVARLAMNHVLRRYRLGYVIFPPLGESPALWEALQEAHRGNPAPLVAESRRHTVRVE